MEHNNYITHIRIRDPFIVTDEEEGIYFLYDCFRTEHQKTRAINVRESRDLIWWSDPYPVFVPDDDFWGPLDLWAPEVHFYKGNYYLISSFRERDGYRGCQFLKAQTPRGPFWPMKNHAATPEEWHCLDGTLYLDKNGYPWMVFCHEWTQVQDGQICAIRMSEDLSEAVGPPVILFRGSEAPWKFTDDQKLWKVSESQPKLGWARVTDGPFLYRAENGELLMLWSSFSNTAYTCGYARSLSGEIEGPWIQEQEPVYSQDGGHGMLFRRLDGQLMLALHTPNIIGKERLALFEINEKFGKLQIINEITGSWMQKQYDEAGLDEWYM